MENWCAEEGRRKWARWEDEVRRKSKEDREEERREEKKEEERRGERERVKNKRKNLAQVMREERLGSVTKTARAEEEERLGRLARLQQEELPGVAEDEEQVKENKEDEQKKANKVQMISSSESDDCKIVQDDHRSPVFQDHDDADEDTADDEDPNNSGLHVNDALNIPNSKGEVLVNVGHPDGDRDALLAPQLAAMAKPHQIGGIRFL